MSLLAKETGGLALINNDLGGGIRRALDDMSGYYLIGYRPEKDTFDPATAVANRRLTSCSRRGRP